MRRWSREDIEDNCIGALLLGLAVVLVLAVVVNLAHNAECMGFCAPDMGIIVVDNCICQEVGDE